MKKEDFKVRHENGVLTISAKSGHSKEEKDDNFVRREFSYSNFERSFWLPENVNGESIAANYDQGVLKLKLPKLNTPPSPKAKDIPIT